jgi:hypothetical protein
MGDAWQAEIDRVSGMKTGSGENNSLKFVFPIPIKLIDGLSGVRLKGISCYSVGIPDATAGCWTGQIRPPITTLNILEDSSLVYFSQDATSVDLGRVLSRDNPKPPDIIGTARLRHMQIIGGNEGLNPMPESASWVLRLNRLSTFGADASKLKDVQLEFYVSASTK